MENTTIVFKEQPKRRSWLRLLVWLAILLVVLVAVAYFVVTSPAFIKGVVLPRVGDALNARVTVSDLSFSPFRQIVLQDLKVQAKDQVPVLTVPKAIVRYHLWNILRGNLHVDGITLDSPTVEIVENPDGSRNVDPLLKALKGKPVKTPPRKAKPSAAPRIDLGRLALRDASIVQVKNYGDGHSNVMELTNLDLTLSNLKNGQSAQVQMSSVLWINNNPLNGTSGFLAATFNGNFNVALTPDLNPASASGKAELTVFSAGAAFRDFSSFGAGLDCNATPTDIKQLDLHFQNAGASLGELAVSGPLDLAKMEGRLQVVLRGVDRRLLNLVGTAHGLDFGSTAISSTNEIILSDSGKTIAAAGRFVADQFQVTRAGQTTPTLDFSTAYSVTVNNAAQTALLHKLTLAGTQDGRSLLAARLSQPMSLAWGNAAAGVGNSALKLIVTNLNLADWRPFLGNAASAGNADLQMKLSSQQGGKQLGFDLHSQINHLVARLGSNQTFQATVALSAQGRATDFKQFRLRAYRLQLTRQNQPLLTASGSGVCDLADASVDAQVALQASLPKLGDAFPLSNASLSSGALRLNGRVTQKQTTQTVSGQLTLTNLTGQIGKNSFSNFGSTMELVVSRTPKQIQVKKLDGTLTQNGSAGGNFALTGAFEPGNQTIQLSAVLSDFNQNGLRPFLEPLLAQKQLVSLAVNGHASLQYAPGHSSAVKADLQVTNLVVHDPKGQFPAAPLAAQLQIDTTLQNQSANIRQFELGLTPTSRAQNQIQVQGQVNFSKPKAIQGNLKVDGNSLDLTRYYDLFAGASKANGQKTVSASPAAVPNQEPPPKRLPLQNFVVAVDLGKIYLHEIAITNFQAKVKLDGSRVLVKPFELSLNGAPVNAAMDLDLSVPGYKYHFAVHAAQVPFAPLVDTFAPDRKGELSGRVTARAQIAGAGTTGLNLKKYLAGQFEVDATKLNLSVINVRSPILKTLINVVATVPQLLSNPETAVISLLTRVTGLSKGGLMNQLEQSPIQTITAQGRIGSGRISLDSAVVQSDAFKADASGNIMLASVLTNSTINIPVTVSLSHSIASQLNLAAANTATGTYVPLPQFLTLTRTLGDPNPKINKLALAGITVKSLGNSLLKPSNGNPSSVGNLLNQFLRQVK